MNRKNVSVYVHCITYLFLVGIIISLLINQNFMIGKGINVIKQKSETEQVTNLQKQLDELNVTQTKYADYIQGCKTQIATALTNEGIVTEDEEKLETMAENISKILQVRTSNATATGEDILEGKTAYINGELIIGTMVNKGMSTVTTIDSSYGGSGVYSFTIDTTIDSLILVSSYGWGDTSNLGQETSALYKYTSSTDSIECLIEVGHGNQTISSYVNGRLSITLSGYNMQYRNAYQIT